ncbi:hypothetical protein LCGC14_0458290 [marine sediment metagenome]|uniref:Large polyvalent protein associated domain-containing protein n=1 Tax=marine sediment metagenome TaxID=412755 RepID=A0A0F9V2T3_9ZZZZ
MTSPIESGAGFTLLKNRIKKTQPASAAPPASTAPVTAPPPLPEISLPERGGFGNLLRPLDWFQQKVQDPFIGAVESAAFKLVPGEQELERRSRELRQQGMNPFVALGQAHREVAEDYPTWLRIGEAIALDPLNLVPGLGFAKLPVSLTRAASLSKGATALTRTIGKTTKIQGLKNPVHAVFNSKVGKIDVIDGQTSELLGQFDTLDEAQAVMARRATEIKTQLDEAAAERIKEVTIADDYARAHPAAIGGDEEIFRVFNDSIAQGGKLRGQIDQLTSAQRAEKLGNFNRLVSKGIDEEAFQNAMGAMRGPVTDRNLMKPLSEILQPTQLNRLFEVLRTTPKLQGYARVDGYKVLRGMVWFGRVPTVREAKLLGQVFGSQIEKTLTGVRGRPGLIEWLNVPRALKSSFDLSASLRQGVLMLPGHPKEWGSAFKSQVNAFKSEGFARMADDAIDAHPLRGLAKQSRLDLTVRGAGQQLAAKEEVWISSLLHDVPGLGKIVRASERAYVTFLNKLRMDTFATLSDDLMKQGKTFQSDPRAFRELAKHINRMTGRGGLGPFEKFGEALTVPFFAPKFFMSRVQLPLGLVSRSPEVRRMVARDMAAFLGTGLTIMTLAHRSGMKIETDPRSSDFGKLLVGPTRWDIWGGLQPLARSLAQIGFEERKSVASGNINKLDRGEAVWRFIRSKFSPSAGFAATQITGQTFFGEEVELTPQDAANLARETLMPLIMDDLWDAIRENGIGGGFAGVPAFFGVGTVSFTTLRELQRKVAEEQGVVYEKMSEMERFQVNQHPDIQAKIAEFQENQEDLDQRERDRAASDIWASAKVDSEEILLPVLESPGAVQRDRIQEYKARRRQIGNALFNDRERDFLRGPQDPIILDDLRERYWSAPLDFDPDLLHPDYMSQQQARAEIIGIASQYGFTEQQVTERKPSTIQDPGVKALIEEYDRDQEVLKRYWNISERVLVKVDSKIAASYRKWKRMDRATAAKFSNFRLEALDRAVTRLRDMMFRGDPEIQQLLIRWGYRGAPLFARQGA